MFKSSLKIFKALLFFFCGVLLYAQESVIAKITIEGNKRTKTAFIKKLAVVKEGSVLDSAKIVSDIRRFKLLPGIAHADFSIKALQDGAAQVTYHIEENFTLIPSLNIYTTNNEEVAYRVGLYEFNALGRNMIIGGFFQKDNFESFALNFRAPYLFSNRFGMAANLQNLVTLEPVFFDNTTSNYKYSNKSIEMLGLYEINFTNRIEIGVNFFNEDYQYQFGATSPAVPLEVNVDKLLLKGIYEYNKLDYFYQYVSGIKSQLILQYVTSNSAILQDFFIGRNDFLYFKRIGEKGNWANRFQLGFATNDETPFAPFSVDNNLNIRGVGNTIDRGTATLVLNTEYRHTWIEKNWFILQSNVFVDTGAWRNPGEEFGDFLEFNETKLYSGIGLRLIHKKIFNAILRIDYGVGVGPNSAQGFVFGIGQYF